MARRRHDQLIHPPCGVPRDIGFDPDNDGFFEAEDDLLICYACAALEERRAEIAEKPDSVERGAQLFVRFTRYDKD